LQILKVEIGGEGQSTDGAEASHSRDPWSPPSFERGYEWWLMTEAKKRNPNITLYGLPWTWPSFISCAPGAPLGNCTGGPFTNITAAVSYITSWVAGAKAAHALDIDWLGVWNERSAGDSYVMSLRAALDAGGFSRTRIITWDNWAWGAPNGSDAMGVHYPGIKPRAFPPGAIAWSSEESSTYNNQFGGECWARVVNQNYAVGNLSASIIWNLAAAYMKGTKCVCAPPLHCGSGQLLLTRAHHPHPTPPLSQLVPLRHPLRGAALVRRVRHRGDRRQLVGGPGGVGHRAHHAVHGAPPVELPGHHLAHLARRRGAAARRRLVRDAKGLFQRPLHGGD
jgi:hypothetical protein